MGDSHPLRGNVQVRIGLVVHDPRTLGYGVVVDLVPLVPSDVPQVATVMWEPLAEGRLEHIEVRKIVQTHVVTR